MTHQTLRDSSQAADDLSGTTEQPPSDERPLKGRFRAHLEIHAVDERRLVDKGDIDESYSADRIGMGRPVRRPFSFGGELWVCTSIVGAKLTASEMQEHEAYRLVPEAIFPEAVTTYNEKTGTSDAADAARNDPKGFYHGMKVEFARAGYVLCGPPATFVAERPDARTAEPAQLTLF